MAVIPKKAATVILLREIESGGFEVFLLKRHEKSSFMGGNFVYPGGRVDHRDGMAEVCSYCKGLSTEQAAQILRGSISPQESLAHWVAAIRELFEEAGVLLAYDHTGKFIHFKDPTEREKASHYRDLIHKGKMNICQIAQEEKVFFALDQLHYYAHWITPEARPERFDTRFFLACHPEGQEASYDQRETTLGVWFTPKQALEENLKGNVPLSPPTLKTLEDLSRFTSIGGVLKSLRKTKIEPILPILTRVKDETLLIFPWDPEFGIFQKGGAPEKVDHGRPSQPNDNTSRLILKKGIWIPYCRSC
ncbi:MAG: NUDIX hydrolase [Thermodesulfobacteriota bacterium]